MDKVLCIDSDRLVLRLFDGTDASPRYLGWLSDPSPSQFLEVRFSILKSMKVLSRLIAAILAKGCHYLFGIFDAALDRHIGDLKICPINRHHATATIGYLIGDSSIWGKCYAPEASFATTNYSFEQLGAQKLNAGCCQENIAPIKVLLKVDSILEGEHRGKVSSAGGGRQNAPLYGVLTEDYSIGTAKVGH